MKHLILAIAFLLAPAFAADAAGVHHKHAGQPPHKSRAAEPTPVPSPPPITRLPIAPDTFRA
jgi:hypothetical protein